MKNLKAFAGVLLSLLLFGTAGCGGNPSDSGTPGGNGTIVENEWEGDWDGGNLKVEEEEGVVHLCTQQCDVCHGCLDLTCEDEVCAKKCPDEEGREKYVFSGVDSKVTKEGGVSVSGDYLGNINQNPNVKITYNIKAEQETVVCLGATISEMGEDNTVTAETPITINGEPFVSRGYLRGGQTNWTEFKTVWLGCVTLKEGVNVIVITNPHSDGQQYNFKDLTFLSPEVLTLVSADEAHVCESKDEEGKCTDYTCNEYACLDKAEPGWQELVIEGGDEKVLKYGYDYYDEEISLWNANENCIGNLTNDFAYGQTVIFSFEATEKTTVRLTLNMSTTFAGSRFADMFEMTIDGTPIETGGRSGVAESGGGWGVYVDGTVAYIEIEAGTHTFMLVHKDTKVGDNIRQLTISYAEGTITAVQAERPIRSADSNS